MRKMCQFYNELHNILGNITSEFAFEICIYDSAVTTNNWLNNTPATESTLDDHMGFENLDEYCSIPVIQYTGSVDIEAESAIMQPSSSCLQTSALNSPSSPTETNGNTGFSA